MGRPLNKRNFKTTTGGIQVKSYRFDGAVEAQATGSIVAQHSVNVFSVTDGTTTERMTLVNKDQGSLDENEFIVLATDSSDATSNVTKFYSNVVQTEGTTKTKYAVSDATPSAGTLSVDAIA